MDIFIKLRCKTVVNDKSYLNKFCRFSTGESNSLVGSMTVRALTVGVVLASLVSASAPVYATDDWLALPELPGTTYVPHVQVEALIVRRSDLDTIQFTGPDNATSVFTPFSTDDLGEKTVGGLRATLNGYILGAPVEFSGFFIMPMELERIKLDFLQTGGDGTNPTYDNNAHLNPNADIASLQSDDVFALQMQHQTYLFGAEANANNALNIPGLLFGIRGLYFGERLASVTFDNSASLNSPSNVNDLRDRTSTRVDNYLLGVQVGYDQMFQIMDGVSFGGSIKAGIYNNNVQRHRTFNRDAFPSTSNTLGDKISDNQFSSVVEISPRLNVQLAPGVELSAGGWFLWIDNVSEASPHFFAAADRDDQDLRADGDVYFWGGSVGLKVQFDQFYSLGNPSSDFELTSAEPGATAEELDDRIAVLEDEAVRRGSKAMSLKVSGQVNQMIMGWDDGDERDAYIVDAINSPSRFKLLGEGRMTRGWTAGYHIEIQSDRARSVNASQDDDDAPDNQFELRHSYMWIRNNELGKLSIGHTSPATDNIILNDLGGVHVAASNDIRLIGGGLLVRHSDEIEQGADALIGITPLIDFLPTLDTGRGDFIRYDTPRWKGLVFSVAWGEDDFWDVAVKYRLNWNDWKLRAGIGFLQNLDEPTSADLSPRDRRELKGSASILHQPTGIFLTGAFTHREYHGERSSDQTTAVVTPDGTNRPDFDYRYFSGGVRQKLTQLGDTSIYGEYAIGKDGVTGRREAGNSGEVTDSEIMMLGAGIVQYIDAASMELYLGVRHFEFQIEGVDSNGRFDAEDLEDINVVYAGAKIKF